MKIDKFKLNLSTTQLIATGFLIAIMIGTLFLMLPISSSDGTYTPFLEALFASTASVSVTGLGLVDTFDYWSFFGQFVILLLIQFGGLGIVTFTTFVMIVIGKKVSLKDRMLIQDAYNLNSLGGLVKFIKKVVIGSLIVESVGALLYMIEFIPKYGIAKGIWISIFNAVSAFCNAGIDIIGKDSLVNYVTNPLINIITCVLVLLGGLGFVVWFDVLNIVKLIRNKKMARKSFFNRLALHTKIVIVATMFLIIIGTILILIFEYNNPETLGDLSWVHKMMAASFQSINIRTSGFHTLSVMALREPTLLVYMVFMFIGGSPVSTAGGIKTISFALIVIAVISVAKADEDTVVFGREIPRGLIRKTLAVVAISIFVVSISVVLLLIFNEGSTMDVVFEVINAATTTGLTRGFTDSLNTMGKIIIIVIMFLGRLGPITMAITFTSRHKKRALVKYPKGNVIIG